jgi:hypothetical protein
MVTTKVVIHYLWGSDFLGSDSKTRVSCCAPFLTCKVLFGLVTGTENQFTPRTNTFNSQEPHNTLPLASSQIR